MNSNRFPNGRYSQHPTSNALITTALEVFAPLAKDYMFELQTIREHFNQFSIRYTNSTTGLGVLYETVGPPTIEIGRLKTDSAVWGTTYDLYFLMQERCPSVTFDDVWKPDQPRESFEGVLSRYVEVLREYAADIMRGDFTVFPAIDRQSRRYWRHVKKQQADKG